MSAIAPYENFVYNYMRVNREEYAEYLGSELEYKNAFGEERFGHDERNMLEERDCIALVSVIIYMVILELLSVM